MSNAFHSVIQNFERGYIDGLIENGSRIEIGSRHGHETGENNGENTVLQGHVENEKNFSHMKSKISSNINNPNIT